MRLKNVMRNSFFSLMTQIVLILLGFCASRVMNHQLGEALVGVNGVIANVLGILSVTELGFSATVVYHLYRVLAEQKEEEIASLMNLYRRAYQIVAAVIGFSGLCLLPFIHHFMRENPFPVNYIRTIYILWLSRTVINYLLSYRRSILIADQREYIVSIMTLSATVLNYSAIILIVFFTRNYVLALTLNILFESIASILLNCYVDRRYRYLRKYRNAKIDPISRQKIFSDLKNIFFSKLSIKILTSTDNLIISGMIGVVINGLYNNYTMMSSSVVNLVGAISNSIQPTMANLFLEGNAKKNCDVFRQISFLFFLIASFSASGLIALMTPFVREFWLGDAYVLDPLTVQFIAASTAVTILGFPQSIVMTVSGLFEVERNLSITASIINISLSILLVRPLGVSGVLLGTIASNLLCIIVRTYFFFSAYLELPWQSYALELLSHIFLLAGETFLTCHVTGKLYAAGDIRSVLLCGLMCLLLPNGINGVLFFKSWKFQSVVKMLMRKAS